MQVCFNHNQTKFQIQSSTSHRVLTSLFDCTNFITQEKLIIQSYQIVRYSKSNCFANKVLIQLSNSKSTSPYFQQACEEKKNIWHLVDKSMSE